MRVIEAPLVERERELEALGRVLEAARRGEGAAALVEGPAGIGKSRLLAAAGEQANDLEVLRARASELERDFPFGVVRQLFEPVLVRADPEKRERLLTGAGRLAERVLVASTADDAVAPEVFAVLHGLYWFAANLAAARPLLLLVDDAQWSDGDSLRWLAFLLHRLDGMPLALMLAIRAREAGAEEALLDTLVSDPSLQVIRPRVLSDAGVARLVELELGDPPYPDFVTACQRATGGNPFLLRELLAELAGLGVGATAESASLVERLSASGVGRAVRARLRRLPSGSLELARAVSVLGDGCELSLAGRLAELDKPAAARAADALAAASVLEPKRPLAFVHPLVRASVYGELGAGERSNWHSRAAHALTQAGADADRVAVQLLACQPAGAHDSVGVLRAAAESARRRAAHDVAATYLRRALQEPPPRELKPHLLRELGSAELQTGQIDVAIQYLRDAIAGLPDAKSRALAAIDLGSALDFTERPEQGVAALSRAIADLPDEYRELGLLLQATAHFMARGSLAAWQRMQATDRRFTCVKEHPQTAGERLGVAVLAHDALFAATAERGRTLALAALDGGKLLHEPGPDVGAFFLVTYVLILADALEEAIQALGAVQDWAWRHGSIIAFARASHGRTYAFWRRGALAEVEAEAAMAPQAVSPQGLKPAVLALVEALLARGDVSGAGEAWREARLDGEHAGGQIDIVRLQTRARLRSTEGKIQEALDDLFECGRLENAWNIKTPALSNWRTDAAGLLDSLGRGEEARKLIREEIDRCRSYGAGRPLGAALRRAGLIERSHVGLLLLEEAVAVLERSSAQLEFSLALFHLGAALRRKGRRASARPLLGQALEVAAECGAEALVVRAHDELVAAGAKPRRDPIESRSKLTASELRVARMAAEGLTNREIAQALFLTEKTIEVHLTRVYRKLEIRSRSQLPRVLPGAVAPSP